MMQYVLSLTKSSKWCISSNRGCFRTRFSKMWRLQGQLHPAPILAKEKQHLCDTTSTAIEFGAKQLMNGSWKFLWLYTVIQKALATFMAMKWKFLALNTKC